MNRILIQALAALLLWTSATVVKADADVIVNEGVSVTSLDKSALKDVLLGKTMYWSGGQAVTIVIITDKTDADIQVLTGMSASQFKTHWQRLTFSGRGQQPKSVDTIERLLSLVSSTKGAVAIAPSGTEIKGVKKLEIK